MRHANYFVTAQRSVMGIPAVVIRDEGPHDVFPTVTNDVEWVVQQLRLDGALPPGKRLFYYDSESELDEIVLTPAGEFNRFAPAPSAF